MRGRWDRAGAISGLLLAIFGDLGRRAWWAYRSGATQHRPTRTSIVARRPAERTTHVPLITPAWQPFVAQALPIQAAAVALTDHDERLPVVWIDAASRPDLADLPRVLNNSPRSPDVPVLATQWLANLPARRVVLVVTFVEPVACSWALSFDLQRWTPVLELVATSALLVVAMGHPPTAHDGYLPLISWEEIPYHMQLPITTTIQLHAILADYSGGTVAD